MEIELKELMDENEMLSHIFLQCMTPEKLEMIKNKYIGEKDWQKESVTVPVEMKIAGIDVNPKEFFNEWKNQMNRIILEEAKRMVSEKLGSRKFIDFQNQLNEMGDVLERWEGEINWTVENPLLEG